MKYIFLFSIIPFFTFCQNWQEFKSDTLGFSINSPYKLVKKSNTAMTDFGNLEVISFGIQAPEKDENFLYQIMVIPYPEGTFPVDSSQLKDLVIQEFIDASHSYDNAEKIYQTSTSLSGYNYEQWVIHFDKKYSIKSKATIKGDSLFVIQVITAYENSVNTDIDKFLDSFKFTN